MWEKRATSAEGKTIRIAESSDMDSWEAVLDHVLKFSQNVQSGDVVTQLYQMEWYELGGKKNHVELWSKEEFWINGENGDVL